MLTIADLRHWPAYTTTRSARLSATELHGKNDRQDDELSPQKLAGIDLFSLLGRASKAARNAMRCSYEYHGIALVILT
ncbi:hypothetical protein AAL_05652 [Moelleriella libera RCEF 2490]|uniref:Uncharacterized protein n=1 Tax=Moelleriella libera RCEF 2490 TaxID=1081109 RepID=A0A167ZZ21_9HYPO|nr:hypothetical protein AAL_05652 [Moelleriella libera RCEF 2490]